MKDYGVILAEVKTLSDDIVKAYDRNDFKMVIALTEQIGSLYSDDDDLLAHRIGHMANIVASASYFGGILHEIKSRTEKRERELTERERKYTPPF